MFLLHCNCTLTSENSLSTGPVAMATGGHAVASAVVTVFYTLPSELNKYFQCLSFHAWGRVRWLCMTAHGSYGETYFSQVVILALKDRAGRCQLGRFMFPLNGTWADKQLRLVREFGALVSFQDVRVRARGWGVTALLRTEGQKPFKQLDIWGPTL